jgi:hypothetical protein
MRKVLALLFGVERPQLPAFIRFHVIHHLFGDLGEAQSHASLDVPRVHPEHDKTAARADQKIHRLQNFHHAVGLAAVQIVDEDHEPVGAQRIRYFRKLVRKPLAESSLGFKRPHSGASALSGEKGRRVNAEGQQLAIGSVE